MPQCVSQRRLADRQFTMATPLAMSAAASQTSALWRSPKMAMAQRIALKVTT
jgi:hypothetical protein